MDEIYRANILDHYRNPHHAGKLEHPDASFDDVSVSCGDRIRIEFALAEQQIADVRFEGHGCAISIAAASILSDMLPGRSRAQALSMPKEEVLSELGINLSPSRQKCALLGFMAMKRALSDGQWTDDEGEAH